jgi:hypothetical protein
MRILVLVLLLAAAAGCGGQQPAARSDGLTVARYTPAGPGGDSAQLTGVAGAQDGCLVVRSGEQLWVPVFATDDDRALALAQGSSVDLGGGEASSTEGRDIPASCPTEALYWIVARP